MADPISGGSNLSPWAWAVLGALAGTFARSSDWWEDGKPVNWKLLVVDLLSCGIVIIFAVLVADWLALKDHYAAGFGAGFAVIGVRLLRAFALRIIEIGISAFAKRVGGDPAPPADDPKP